MSDDVLLNSAGQGVSHADYIYSVVERACPSDIDEEFSSSWRRSICQFGLDPAAASIPRVLSARELKEIIDPIDEFLRIARVELDLLYTAVRAPGYVVLLSDATGVAVELRGEESPSRHLRNLGSCVGGVWSEEVHGTNGIGTCIIEERPVTVHRAQHFRSRHTHLSCSGAPVFGIDGKLVAALDVSSVDPTLSERAHALTGHLTTAAAHAIEERFFRTRFRDYWVIAIPTRADTSGVLLAVDREHVIVGANRTARDLFSLDDCKLRGEASLWTLFKHSTGALRSKHNGDFFAPLVVSRTGEEKSALVTPPATARASLPFHTRPRLDLLKVVPVSAPSRPAHGGLSPHTLGRVCAYIAEHLTERLELLELSALAGLSASHFAREFKRSVGITPHSYVTQKRVEMAERMLVRTDMPLSEVALLSGFFDQSHLARHFRERVGVTPAKYRWSHR
ncbi:helix-turn-helix domain-containing protein [Bordetella sp. H567]|uniref:helix-turn-helix domain-containing protein n=1 Tax=Bordetella sp. H567 TaxID=1697043 RepID=UPI000B28B681|nr:helix-turn-helix domain-containing protein [Bordetella sp. H567]